MFGPSIKCLRALRTITCFEQRPASLLSARSYSTEKPPSANTPGQTQEKDEFLDPSRETRADGPRFLNRPLGLPFPPFPGDNTGVDSRSMKQRRQDFVDHEKHIQKRQKLAKELFRPYFKDFNDMAHYKGKVFFAPERVFKAQFAKYFPNLRGRTLQGNDEDTTNVLQGKVSLVSVSSSEWAENQVKSFCDEASNPGVAQFLDHLPGAKAEQRLAQLVEINWEPNNLKHWIIKLFKGRLQAARDKSRWSRYFIVHKGFSREIRQAIGMSNEKVGHVYLLDEECRIRWAGHAVADPIEKASMIKALGRLLSETQQSPKTPEKAPIKPKAVSGATKA